MISWISNKATQPERFQPFRKSKNVKIFTDENVIGLNGREVTPVDGYERKKGWIFECLDASARVYGAEGKALPHASFQ